MKRLLFVTQKTVNLPGRHRLIKPGMRAILSLWVILAMGLLSSQEAVAQCAATTAPTIGTATASLICPTRTVDLSPLVTSSTPAGTTLEWHTVNNNPTSANLVAMPVSATGTYYAYYYDDANNCYSSNSVAVTVTDPAISAPNATITNNSLCEGGNGIITFTAPTPLSNYEFAIDGGDTYQSSPNFPGLKAGSYSLIVRSLATHCESALVAKTITDAPVAIVAPTVTVGNVTNCITPNGSLTVTAPTPLTAYQFSIDGINFQASNIFTGLPGGTYNVVAKSLATGCVSAAAAKTITTPTVTSPTTTVTNPTSCIVNNGIIAFTAPTPLTNYQFSIDGGQTFSPVASFTGLSDGVYDTQVKLVSSGCVSAIVSKTLVNPVATSPTTTVVNNTNCNNANGSITFTAPTPLTNYQFSIDGGDTYHAITSFTGLSANTYNTRVKLISTGCESLIVAKTVTDAPTVVTVPTASVTNVTNCNVPNGIIAITAPTPLTAYQFSIDGGNTFSPATSYTGLAAGTYNVVSKQLSTGCVSAAVAKVVANPTVTSPTASFTNNTSCLNANGAIAITAPTPLTAYQFSIDGGATYQDGSSFTGLSGNAYAVTVKLKSSGCESAAVVTTVSDAPVAIATPVATVKAVTNCITPNGSLTITAPTPLTAYQFSIDGGLTFQTSNIFNNLDAGSYELIAKSNATGCLSPSGSGVITTTAVTAPTVSVTNNTNCSSPNGIIKITAPTPLANYEFSIDGGDTFSSATIITGLTGGSYNVIAKLVASGCQSAATVAALTDAAVAVTSPTTSVTQPTSCAPGNGIIAFTAPTPLASYEFSIDGGSTYQASPTFTGLAPGTYQTRIRLIATGCESAAVAKILTGPTITAPTASVTNNSSCNIQPNGVITITAPTPLANYQFSIDNGITFSSAASFTGLTGGNYALVSKAIATGCTSASVAKALTNAPVAVATPTANVTNVTSCVTPNGSIVFTAPTALTAYQFSIDGGATFTNSSSFTGLLPGTYILQAKHIVTSCLSATTTKAVTGPVVTAPTATAVNPTSCASPNGTITVTAPTPLASYEFSINGGATFQAGAVFSNLAAGTYSVVTRSLANGCTSTAVAKTLANPTVTAPTATIANNTTCFSPNGSINVTAPTPLASYLFSIDGGANFQTNPLFTGLAAGTYNVVVQSIASGCNSAAVAKIITNAPPAVVAPTTTQVNNTNCITPNGVITFTAPTPLANYQFSIDGGATFQTANSFTGLTGGNYIAIIKSIVTGCVSATVAKALTNPTVTAPTATVVNNTDCRTPNGIITISAPTPLANYQFSKDGGATFQSVNSFTGLTAGTYPIAVKLITSGCVSATVAKAVTSPAITVPTTTVVNNTDCSSPNGKITFTAPAPLTNYEFSINGGATYQSGINFTGLAAGTYLTRVRALASGCESATVAKAITNPTVAAPTATVINTTNCNTPNGSIKISAPIPLASYQFSIDGGATFQSSPNFLGLADGTYKLVSKLIATGCVSTTAAATITKPAITAPVIPASVTAITNTCPDVTGNLLTAQPIAAANTSLEWHIVGANPTLATLVANPASVSTIANYYLYAKSNINGCYSAASLPVALKVNSCLDTDGDGVPDYVDVDDDNDGVLDVDEAIACSPFYWSYANFKVDHTLQSYSGDLLRDGVKVADVSFVIPNVGTNRTGFEVQATETGIAQTDTRVTFVTTQSTAGGDHYFNIEIRPLPGITIKSPFRIIQPGYAPVWVNHPGQHYAILGNNLDGSPSVGMFREVYDYFLEFNGLMVYHSGDRYTNPQFAADGSGVMDLMIEADHDHPYIYQYHQVDIYGNTFINERVNIDVPQCIYGPLADFDGDGITNEKDLDSDNDGCSDAFEAGMTTNQTANYSFTGTVGANGYMNFLETSLDNGTPVITPTYQNAIDANIHACDLPCNAGTVAPQVPRSKTAVCPATTIDLSTLTAPNKPTTGTVVITWHTSATATDANKLTPSQVAAAPAGTYYAAFYDVPNGCYSGTGWNGTATTKVTVFACPPCNAGTTAPTLSTLTVANVCPAKTATLAGVTASNMPANTSLSWHNSATATAANRMSNTIAISSGTYYAAFYDAVNGCFSPTTAVTVVINNCPPTVTIIDPAIGATASSTNPAVSGTATLGSSVTVTTLNGQTCITLADENTGDWTCTSLTFTPGSQTVTAITSTTEGVSTPATTTFVVPSLCPNPSVGGSLTIVGTLPLCSVSNQGVLTLSGHTGTIVKWQSSTDGGSTWADLASTAGLTQYSFTNAQNNQQYRVVVNNGGLCPDANSTPFTVTTSAAACTVNCVIQPVTITK